METTVKNGGEGLAVFLAASMSWSMRSVVISRGFSQMTCLPAFKAASAGSRCAPEECRISNDFQIRIREEFVDVRVGLAAVFGSELFSRFGSEIENGLEFAARHGSYGFCVEVTDHAGADDSEFHVKMVVGGLVRGCGQCPAGMFGGEAHACKGGNGHGSDLSVSPAPTP